MTNRDLANLIDDTIKNTGVTKTHIAKQLNVSRQQIDNILAKQNFSIDDNVIDKISNDFINEAISSPNLLAVIF